MLELSLKTMKTELSGALKETPPAVKKEVKEMVEKFVNNFVPIKRTKLVFKYLLLDLDDLSLKALLHPQQRLQKLIPQEYVVVADRP